MCALAAELGYPAELEAFAHRVRTILQRPDDHLLLVAQQHDDGTVYGWIQGHAAEFLESGRRADIVGLVVSSAVRRRGVGRALVEQVEVWAKSIGADRIGVRSNVQRIESHLFYPALGYHAVKTQIAYRKEIG
jgi:GNAT superfamily N-acetyltransferase